MCFSSPKIPDPPKQVTVQEDDEVGEDEMGTDANASKNPPKKQGRRLLTVGLRAPIKSSGVSYS